MVTSESFVVDKNKASRACDIMGQHSDEIIDDDHIRLPRVSISAIGRLDLRDDDCGYNINLRNEYTLLLPDGRNTESDEDDVYQKRANAPVQFDYRHENRFIILALVALTPTGVKYFKAAQSSFEEYLMNDPRISMSATTYSLSLSLMSLPLATIIGGLMLDYKAETDNDKCEQQRYSKGCIKNIWQNRRWSEQSCLGTSRTPSYSAIFFLWISLLGIVIYGYGLETLNSIPMGLIGATIFGLGEGCVVVAARTFVAHAFYGSDGAFAQGVLVAMNNVAMMASKISLPWLIENRKKMRPITSNFIHNRSLDCFDDVSFSFNYNATISKVDTENDDNDIWIGIVACCVVQLLSLFAGVLYAWWFGLAPLPQRLQTQLPQEHCHASRRKSFAKKKSFLFSDSSIQSRVTACIEKLPKTFWIVAIGRAIFVVVFKVFTRNSNSFLMEKFGVGPVAAGIKSSFHELFALGSPLVGYLVYRSSGGIVLVLIFAAALGSVSIATLACVPADCILIYIPGGAVTPMIGISIAHGIFIPICMAIIPQTCSPDQNGMAFAVVEVLGSILNLTNILFGWLRDTTGNYEVPMEILLVYTLVGMLLLWISRNHIELKQLSEQ